MTFGHDTVVHGSSTGADRMTTKRTNDLAWAIAGPPLGLWRTFNGTIDSMMQDTLCVRADRTGYVQGRSVTRGTEYISLVWRQFQPGVIEFALQWVEQDVIAALSWETVRYGVSMISSLGLNGRYFVAEHTLSAKALRNSGLNSGRPPRSVRLAPFQFNAHLARFLRIGWLSSKLAAREYSSRRGTPR
jgi:hypothetical protein